MNNRQPRSLNTATIFDTSLMDPTEENIELVVMRYNRVLHMLRLNPNQRIRVLKEAKKREYEKWFSQHHIALVRIESDVEEYAVQTGNVIIIPE
jgi:hypothetical protein